jgi:hypothetical protein
MITEKQRGNRVPDLYEVVNAIDAADSEEQIVGIVKDIGSKHTWFTDYLRCLFDEKIQFLLPEGRPPFTPNEPGAQPNSWKKQHLQLTYFVKGLKGDQVSPVKRETMFINLLESIHPEDALLVADMADKRCPSTRLTKEVVEKALPNLL